MHSEDFDMTSLDKTTPVDVHSEHAKKKSTLDYVQQAAFQLYKQDHIPWKQYTKHLKKKQRPEKPVDLVAPVNDSNWDTPL